MPVDSAVCLFDFGGVIAEEGFREGLYAIAQKSGYEPAAFHQSVSRIIADCGYLTGRSDEAVFWSELRRAYVLKQTDSELRGEILSRFALRPAMLDLVARVRAGGRQVGILSDQTNWLDELDRRDGFFPAFDYIFNSFHLHASKYHGDLFAAVADALRTAPEKLLVIDDNAENIKKARQRGFAAVLYTSKPELFRELESLFRKV